MKCRSSLFLRAKLCDLPKRSLEKEKALCLGFSAWLSPLKGSVSLRGGLECFLKQSRGPKMYQEQNKRRERREGGGGWGGETVRMPGVDR